MKVIISQKKLTLKIVRFIISMSHDLDFDNILIKERSYKNILAYNISHKTFIEAKRLRIRFDNVDEIIWVYDGNRYIVLFGVEKHDFIYNRIRYLIEVKSSITYVISHKYS